MQMTSQSGTVIQRVRVVDEAGLAIQWMNREVAARYVKEGRAKLSKTGKSIKFNQSHSSHIAAMESRFAYDRASQQGKPLDLFLPQRMRRIPFVGSPSILLVKRSGR